MTPIDPGAMCRDAFRTVIAPSSAHGLCWPIDQENRDGIIYANAYRIAGFARNSHAVDGHESDSTQEVRIPGAERFQ